MLIKSNHKYMCCRGGPGSYEVDPGNCPRLGGQRRPPYEVTCGPKGADGIHEAVGLEQREDTESGGGSCGPGGHGEDIGLRVPTPP